MLLFLYFLLVPGVAAITAWPIVSKYFGVYTTIETVTSNTTFTSTGTKTARLTVTTLPPFITPFTTSINIIPLTPYPLTEYHYHISLDPFEQPWPTETPSSDKVIYAYYEQVVLTQPSFCTGSLSTYWNHYTTTPVTPHPAITALLLPIETRVNRIYTAPPGRPYDRYTFSDFILSLDSIPTATKVTSAPAAVSDKEAACRSPGVVFSSSDDSKYDTLTPREKKILVLVLFAIGALILLGFIEHFWWFRRLMHGKRALRLGTICWAILVLGIPLIWWKGSIVPERKDEDKRILMAKWMSLGWKERLRSWVKYGFRRKWPVILGKNDGYYVDDEADDDAERVEELERRRAMEGPPSYEQVQGRDGRCEDDYAERLEELERRCAAEGLPSYERVQR